MKKLVLILSFANALVACKADNPSLTAKPLPPIQKISYAEGESRADGLHQAINNQVDILFVLDDSDSMKPHLKNVSENIEKFANELAKIKSIDFHIAFTKVFDRDLVQVCPAGTDRAGQRNYDDAGTLTALKGAGAPDANQRRYVTRQDDFINVMKTTVSESKTDYVEENVFTPNVCPMGPEREESTTPLLAVLESNPNELTTNKGFRRKTAKFVAIIVSDAKDAAVDNSIISLDQVYQRLMLATHSTEDRKNVRVFSVVIKPGSKLDASTRPVKVSFNGSECGIDPAFAEPGSKKVPNPRTKKMDSQNKWVSKTITMNDNPLAKLAQMTEDEGSARIDQVVSICDENYGTALARFGTRIQQDILADLVVPLDRAPQIVPGQTPVTVMLGGAALRADKWSFQIKNGVHQIVIPAKGIDWSQLPADSEVLVKYTEVDLSRSTSKYWQ